MLGNNVKEHALFTKLEFLSLGFKGYSAFRNICRELGVFTNLELFMFWDFNTYSYSTYLRIQHVLDQLKNE